MHQFPGGQAAFPDCSEAKLGEVASKATATMATRVPAMGGPCSSLPFRPKQLEQLARDQGTAVPRIGALGREGGRPRAQAGGHLEGERLGPYAQAPS